MSFLSGFFLWALPLAAVPVMIHLFNRRRRQVVQWGAMQFLSDSRTKKRRIWRVDDLILMLLRAALVLLIVAALARPLLHSSWLGGGSGREVVLVIDTSLSMSRKLERETVLDKAAEQAGLLLDELGDGDTVRVLLASNRPLWLTPSSLDVSGETRDQILAGISKLQPTLAKADLFAAVQLAVQVEPPHTATSRTIAVLTDGSRHGWQSDATAAWTGVRRMIENAPVPTSINVLELADGEGLFTNLSIDGLETDRKLVGVDDQIVIRTVVTNRGPESSPAVLLNWEAEDEPLGVSSINPLEPGESATIQFEHQLETAGVFEIRCRIDRTDDLPADSTGALVVEAIEKVPLLIVQSEEAAENRRSDADYLLAALGRRSDSSAENDWESVFHSSVHTADELESLTLSDYFAIVLVDVPELSQAAVERLGEYVASGGGLWITLGEQTDPETFNALFYNEGDGLAPMALGEIRGDPNNREEFDLVHPPEGEHVATRLLGDTQRLDVDEVRIYGRHQFQGSAERNNVSVLLRSGRGQVLAAEKYTGRGRVIVQCLPIGLSWSNLPLCHIYVPLVHEWLWYLAEPAVAQRNVQPGEPLIYSQDVSPTASKAVLHPPVGDPVEILPILEERREVFAYHQAFLPGSYSLQVNPESGSPLKIPFHVVRDVEESNLTPLDDSQRALLVQAGGLRFTSDALEVPPGDAVEVRREPVWSLLLAAFLLLIVLEMLIACWSTSRRFGYRTASA